MMSKEESTTKFFFDDKIARVIFEDDPERKVYWFEVSDRHFHFRHHLFHHYFHLHHYLQFPIEEWLKENNIIYPFDEDGLFQFKLRWL